MVKLAKKVEQQKKFPKEQQVPRLWPSQFSHSSGYPIALWSLLHTSTCITFSNCKAD